MLLFYQAQAAVHDAPAPKNPHSATRRKKRGGEKIAPRFNARFGDSDYQRLP
jgi:hypothetical protein